MKSERDIYEKDLEKISSVETRSDLAKVGDELERGKLLPVAGEGLAEGKPSASATGNQQERGVDEKIFGAVTGCTEA